MAEEAVKRVAEAECAFCLNKLPDLIDPRRLPCSHVHCMKCLNTGFMVNKIVRCPICRKVFDVPVDSLPSAYAGDDDFVECDVCRCKGKKGQQAVTFCTSCRNKYCVDHREWHDDGHEDHSKISIAEYRTQASKLERKLCTEHEDEPYIMGCRLCLTVCCVKCFCSAGTCTDGRNHQPMPLNDLVLGLHEEFDCVRVGVEMREKVLDDVLKTMSNRLTDYEMETKGLVEMLHKSKKEQMEDIESQYSALEVELVTSRVQSLTQMFEFTEENVGAKLIELTNNREVIEASLRDNHQVDVINGYREKQIELSRLMNFKIPKLSLQSVTLQRSGETHREVELKVVSEEEIHIDCEQVATTPESTDIQPPHSLTRLHKVPVSGACESVCHYKGNTYVGCLGGVDKIDANYESCGSLISGLDGAVHSISVYKNRIYTLVNGEPCIVYVHDLEGQLITQWDHTDIKKASVNKIVIIDEQIVIPNRANQTLTVYSLTGNILRSLPCPRLDSSIVCMCAVDSNSVIICSYLSECVFRFSLSDSTTMWSSSLGYPGGVACFGQDYALVYSSGTDDIHTLDMQTGEALSEIMLDELGSSMVDNLYVASTTLILPDYFSNEVIFYEVN